MSVGMSLLFLGFPAHGHTNPTLPLVRELVGRGESVTYYGTEPFRDAIEATGADFRPYRSTFLTDLRGLPERMDALAWLLARTTSELLDAHLDEWRILAPDRVIADSVAPWGQWAGEAVGAPVVTSVSTFAVNRAVLGYSVRHGIRPSSAGVFFSKLRHIGKAILLVRQLRRRHRLQGPPFRSLVLGESALNIVYTSRAFQPCADRFDDRYAFVGPSMADRHGSADVSWLPQSELPLIYISLGTLFNTDPSFFRTCIDAFRHEPVRVAISVGDSVNIDALGTPPAHVVLRRFVPQLAVLSRAAAFVTHGGMNSVSESLASGVPMVIIPQMAEQALVGRRVEDVGAGLYMDKHLVTAERLRMMVRDLLSASRFKTAANSIRTSFAQAGGVARAADLILASPTKRRLMA